MTTDINQLERHPWPPFVPDSPRVLVMGTFPPQPHRWAMDFYYPNRTNDFWKVMGLIFYNDINRFYDPATKSFNLADIKQLLTERRIAMSDTGRAVVRLRDNASDKYLDIRETIDIVDFLDRYPTLTTMATTGEKAAGVIAAATATDVPSMGQAVSFIHDGRQVWHWRMPSTSRAYPLAVEKKAAYYQKMFDSAGILDVK